MEKASKQFSTDDLTKGLIRTKDLRRYLANHADSLEAVSLPEYLSQLLAEKQLKRSDVIQRSNLDRTFAYQIFDGSRSPSRDKVLQLAFGFGLNYEETCELLRIARKSALYVRLKREAIIVYCISHSMSIIETQYMLVEAGLTALGQERD